MKFATKLTVFAVASALVLGLSAVAFGSVIKSGSKVTIEQARKVALKKVEGTIEEEYSIEDEDGNVTDFVFYIKDKKGKMWEVQIGAEKGDVVSAEMQEDEDSGDPPANS